MQYSTTVAFYTALVNFQNTNKPVIDTLEDETYHLEANQHNAEHRLVLLQLNDGGVDSISQQDTVLNNENEVEEKLAD